MKIPLGLRAVLVGVLPYLLHSQISIVAGAPHIQLPPITDLSPLLNDLPALATTLVTWYEVVVRLVPTARNFSLLARVVAVLENLVPNRAAPNATISE